MTERHRATELEKEFELERVMLFSDAVFAIAITLLIIEIKWPELPEKLAGVQWDTTLGPMIVSFIGFVLSFFFIGHFWSGHLRLFKLLHKYDQGLINRNLLFLFFIVTFPFTASGLFGHTRPGFLLPLYVYLGNLVLVSAANLNLCWYMFRHKHFLSIDGKKEEKKYIFIQSRNATLAMLATIVVVATANILFPGNPHIVWSCCSASGIFLAIGNRKASKFAP